MYLGSFPLAGGNEDTAFQRHGFQTHEKIFLNFDDGENLTNNKDIHTFFNERERKIRGKGPFYYNK